MNGIRTDMALELHEALAQKPEGVDIETFETSEGILITRVRVTNEAGEKALGKPIGQYITLDMENISRSTPEERRAKAEIASEELKRIIDEEPPKSTLIIGLGNRDVTPDSLGPKTCEGVFVTRHIKQNIPEAIDERVASISIMSPGVLGVTGMETGEVVLGAVKETAPDLIIAIDSLAARNTKRIGASIQISDTGIAPGSGLGNKRKELTKNTLGVRVIAIGVPMVTYASTIALDIVERVLGQNAEALRMKHLISTVVGMEGGELIVTPKEIDILSQKTAELLSDMLNMALHPTLTRDEIHMYMS